MSDDIRFDADAALEVFEDELERWNTQINLVSRVETRARIRDLLTQCRAGWSLVRDELENLDRVDGMVCFDLGSGGGFPGLVWACERLRDGVGGPSVLVEPREKRAWFLRRTSRAMDLGDVHVNHARWGEAGLPGGISIGGERVLISLKALRLDDRAILDGLVASVGAAGLPREVVISRFMDPKEKDRDRLRSRFIEPADDGDSVWGLTDWGILGRGDPRILISRYSLI